MIESRLLPQFRGFIAGRWEDAASGRRLSVRNPFDGEVLAEVPAMGAAETVRAVEAAAGALLQPPSLEERRRLLTDLAALVREEREEVGRIITLENGKPLAEGIGEAEYAAGFYGFAAEHLALLESRTLEERPRGHRWIVHYRPAGVAGLITPWNFPFAMIAKKLSAALAAGAPSVLKPAEKTPLSMIALLRLVERAGFPRGLVNLVMGDAAPIGRVLCTHPAVRVISFTGSTAVGKLLLEQCAPHCKRVTLELGGNAPFLIFADADLDRAADHLVQNKLRAAGQTCVCANRILVHRAVADEFEQRLVARLRPLRVGNGMQAGVAVGPLIDRAGFEKLRRHLEDALDNGARVVFQGQVPEAVKGSEPRDSGTPAAAAAAGSRGKRSRNDGAVTPAGGEADRSNGEERNWGWFFPPTVLRGARAEMLCAREETFGPLFPLFEFGDEEEAIAMANDTEYGLAAYLFTADDAQAEQTIARLHYGHVGHNTGTGPTPEAPFGGMQQSGIGREGGIEGLLDFVEIQTVPRA